MGGRVWVCVGVWLGVRAKASARGWVRAIGTCNPAYLCVAGRSSPGLLQAATLSIHLSGCRQQLFWTPQRFAAALLADEATVTDDPDSADLYVVRPKPCAVLCALRLVPCALCFAVRLVPYACAVCMCRMHVLVPYACAVYVCRMHVHAI